jgi:hypothetical protein
MRENAGKSEAGVMERKVLFLDIDGVLCLYPEWQTEWCGNQNASLSNCCCENLKRILDATGAKIVLTSSWRLHHKNIVDLYVQFESSSSGLTKEDIIGQTEDFRKRDEVKGHVQMRWWEINDYIEKNGITDYIIIDDFNLERYDKEHFIKTKRHIGLTAELAAVAIRLLGGKKC